MTIRGHSSQRDCSVHEQLAEAVGEENLLRRNVFLMDEALLRQAGFGKEIEDGADAGRRGHLDGAVHLARRSGGCRFCRIGLLDQPALACGR